MNDQFGPGSSPRFPQLTVKKAGQGRPNVTSQTPFGEINRLREGGPADTPVRLRLRSRRKSRATQGNTPPPSCGLRVCDLGSPRSARACGERRGSWEDGGLGTLSEVGVGGSVLRPAPRPDRFASSKAPTGMVAARLVYGRKAGLGLARHWSGAHPPERGLAVHSKLLCGSLGTLSTSGEGWQRRLSAGALGRSWRSLSAIYTAI